MDCTVLGRISRARRCHNVSRPAVLYDRSHWHIYLQKKPGCKSFLGATALLAGASREEHHGVIMHLGENKPNYFWTMGTLEDHCCCSTLLLFNVNEMSTSSCPRQAWYAPFLALNWQLAVSKK